MFKRISAKNLFSWEELEYEIKPGISQITGFNFDDGTSEGSGKSSIPNILCWVLYGGIPKDARIDDVIRQGCKSGSGKVELDSGHSISRRRHPNDVFITKPNGEILKGKDAKETQELINNLIGLDFHAFCQTVYFAQNYPKKFISSSETEKVGILSQVLDLTVFDKARKKSQEEIKTEESKLTGLQRTRIELAAARDRLKSNAALLVQFIERFEQEKTNKIKQIKDKLETSNAKIEKLEAEKKTWKAPDNLDEMLLSLSKSLEGIASEKIKLGTSLKLAESAIRTKLDLEQDIKRCEARLEKARNRVAKYSPVEGKASTCPTCGSPMALHKVKNIATELKELAQDVTDQETELSILQTKLSNLGEAKPAEGLRAEFQELEKKSQEWTQEKIKIQKEKERIQLALRTIETQSRIEESNVKECKDELTRVKTWNCEKELQQLVTIDEQLTDSIDKLEEIDSKISNSSSKINSLELLKSGFKEVKQFVFQNLLAELSVKATRLASELFEVPVNIEFSNEDEDGGISKILTLITLDGVTRPLGLLSGGQYRRIEIAVDLGLASIVANRSHNPIKFRILDEPFKDLSEVSMEKVIKLVENLEGSTIIIEHNSITKSIIHNVFDIEYRNGVSKSAA